MTDQEIIRNFVNSKLWELNQIPIILGVKVPRYSINSIGSTTGKFTSENYAEMYNLVLKDENYQIAFQDESLISMYYKFSDSGDIERYNLSFIPVVNDETAELSMLDYIRIDFDPQGFKKILHERQHIHIGISFHDEKNTEELRKELRIPVVEKIYPWDFIYLISRFVYHIDTQYDRIFKKFIVERCQMIKVEEQLLHLSFTFND